MRFSTSLCMSLHTDWCFRLLRHLLAGLPRMLVGGHTSEHKHAGTDDATCAGRFQQSSFDGDDATEPPSAILTLRSAWSCGHSTRNSPMPSMMRSKGPRHLRSSLSVFARRSCFSASFVCTALRLNNDHQPATTFDMPPRWHSGQPMSAAMGLPLVIPALSSACGHAASERFCSASCILTVCEFDRVYSVAGLCDLSRRVLIRTVTAGTV